MKTGKDTGPGADELRRRAEELSARLGRKAPETGAEADPQRLVHELEVHQIELELQNDELMGTREALEESLARYVDLYDFSPMGYLTLGPDGAIQEVNLTAATLLGPARSALVGRRLGQFFRPESRPSFNACLARALGNARGHCVCDVVLGGERDAARHLRLDMLAYGEGKSCRVAALDISEDKKVQSALARERRFLRRVIDASPSLIFVKDRSGRYLLANEAMARCYGTTAEAVLGRTDAEFAARPAEVQRFLMDDRQVMESRVAKYIPEEPVTCADGQVRWFATYKVPLVEGGRCDRVLGVATDITERRQAEAELREAARRKDEFLAMLGHELRNPLVPLRNAAYVLGRMDFADPKLQWAQGLIEQQVAHLGRLVDDLLDVGRIVRGGVEIRREPVELAEVVAQALETARVMMEARGHALELSLPEEPVWLEGDRVRLTQVLVNLLGNAAKYTDSGGHVALAARVADGELVLTVRDDGIGMPPELLPRVFDLFCQGERGLERAQGGLGIGLTLVRGVVELHGGRVEVESPGPGQGSTFTVRLPVLARPPEAHPAEAPAHAAAGVRVLLVEDDPAVAESTAAVLGLGGHEVRIAGNGEAALALLAEFRPRLVLLDIGLAGMDGYEVARRMRALPEGRGPLLVAVTGYGGEEAQERSAAAGFDAHLTKPVDLDVLAGLLAEAGGWG
jgi:PAS domain S-box-containing protein